MRKECIIGIAAALFFLMGLAPSCRSHKTIPDKDLTVILKEIYLANAYIQTASGVNPSRDSLDIYRPILGKYGYSLRDFEYTLANFSKRKSVKIADVVEKAIRELEAEESDLRFRASVLDTIDSRAQRAYQRDIFRDSTITAMAVRDTALLHVAFPVRTGIYRIGYFYEIDSTDKNRQLKTTYTVTDTAGKRTSDNTSWLSARRRTRVDMTITTRDGDSLMTVRFGNYPDDLTRPHITIDSLSVTYKPLLGEALDSLDRVILPYKNLLDRWE